MEPRVESSQEVVAMSNFWVVVADASKARFFRGTSPTRELEEFHDLVNEEVRQREGDLVTDKPGRFHDDQGDTRPGAPRSSTQPSAKDQSATEFAREVAGYLDRHAGPGDFKALSIVAEPEFLGRLRKALADTTKDRILEEVNKNLTQSREDEIREHLERLPGGFR
ncbi:MAG: host attachment protein [Bradymonadaceae bacterium]